MPVDPFQIRPGQVYLVDLGAVSEGQVVGHEQGNTRPCLVLNAFPVARMAYIVPFTSTLFKVVRPWHVMVAKGSGPQSPLSRDSVALCHQMRAVSTDRFIKHLGQLPDDDFDRIKYVVLDMIG